LCEAEIAARAARSAEIRRHLGIPDEAIKTPTIALVTSGGGMRAMIGSVGFFNALKEMGILDIATYTSAASGSTWQTAKWMHCEENPFVSYKDCPDPDIWCSDVLPQESASRDISKLVATGEAPLSRDVIKDMIVHGLQNLSLLLGYAVMLSKKLGTDAIGANHQTWVKKGSSGKFPIPVCSASFLGDDDNFHWVDFTPFEIGSTFLKSFFALDDFRIGNTTPPPKLSQLMGIWGSIFYATIKEELEEIGITLPEWMRGMVEKTSILHGISVANVNYNRVDPTTGELLPMANQKFIPYRDAGLISNLPIPPMLRPERGVDLLVVFDATAFEHVPPYYEFSELVTAVPALKDVLPKDHTFPCVFPATNDYPTIIYIPAMFNKEYDPAFDPAVECSTFKFQYSAATTTKLEGLAYHMTMRAKQQIWDAVHKL